MARTSETTPPSVRLSETMARVRQLQREEQLTVVSAGGVIRERAHLVAQLEEHNYHLQYNLRMRDIVVDSLDAWDRDYYSDGSARK